YPPNFPDLVRDSGWIARVHTTAVLPDSGRTVAGVDVTFRPLGLVATTVLLELANGTWLPAGQSLHVFAWAVDATALRPTMRVVGTLPASFDDRSLTASLRATEAFLRGRELQRHAASAQVVVVAH